MLIKGVVECNRGKNSFGCIIGEDGKAYLFDSGHATEGQIVTFKVYKVRDKFLRAIDIKNYLEVLENYYFVLEGKQVGSDRCVELSFRYKLLKENPMDISKSRTAKIALEKLKCA